MVRVKCSCGEVKMFVEIKHTCNECVKNGFCVDYELVEKLNLDKDCTYYYGEGIKQKIEKTTGVKIVRTEVREEGECRMGCSSDEGCVMYICSSCKKCVGYVPFIGGC